MSDVSKVSLLRVRQVESGKKWINFYKQGVEDLRFEQRDFNFVIQFIWERDWLGETKNDLFQHAFLRKRSYFSLKQKQRRITLHATLYFTMYIFYAYMNFLSFGCFQEDNDGEKLAGNNNNFTCRIRSFTLRRGIHYRWFGRRCRHWFVYHIQHRNAFETTENSYFSFKNWLILVEAQSQPAVKVNILLAFGVMKLVFAQTFVAWYLHIIFKIKVLNKQTKNVFCKIAILPKNYFDKAKLS